MLSGFNTFCGQYENIIKAFGALAPFFGTVFLAYIAYQQWQTNERKRKHELFELRYKFYLSMLQALKVISKQSTDKSYEYAEAALQGQYLVKEKTCIQLGNYLENLQKQNNLTEKQIQKHEDELTKILEPYLRIEPEETIWGVIINFISGTYEFLTPKWLQNFLSKAKTVILNWFQNFNKKK